MALAVVTTCLSLGMVIGPPLTGAIIEQFGWAAAGYALAILAAVGSGALIVNRNFK